MSPVGTTGRQPDLRTRGPSPTHRRPVARPAAVTRLLSTPREGAGRHGQDPTYSRAGNDRKHDGRPPPSPNSHQRQHCDVSGNGELGSPLKSWKMRPADFCQSHRGPAGPVQQAEFLENDSGL